MLFDGCLPKSKDLLALLKDMQAWVLVGLKKEGVPELKNNYGF